MFYTKFRTKSFKTPSDRAILYESSYKTTQPLIPLIPFIRKISQNPSTHINTYQHILTHINTYQHILTHINIRQHTSTLINIRQPSPQPTHRTNQAGIPSDPARCSSCSSTLAAVIHAQHPQIRL